MKSAIGSLFVGVVVVAGCNNPSSGAPSPTTTGAASASPAGAAPAAGGDVPCSAVVSKLMSFDTKAGDAEKAMYGKMCEGMTPQMRACIAAAGSPADRDACGKGQKAF
jgi:hypothetical protein